MKLETSARQNVFYEEKKVCNKGRARYLLDVASSKNFSVTEDFAAAVCSLTEHFDKMFTVTSLTSGERLVSSWDSVPL